VSSEEDRATATGVACTEHFVKFGHVVFGRPFVKRFALCYRSVSCPVCPVCDVRALWPNGWTDQDETWHAGRPTGPGHIVLDGDPAPPSPKGHSPPIFGPYLLRPNGCMDQDDTWYGSGDIVLDGDPAPLRKRRAEPPNFRPMFIVATRLDG